MTTLNTYKSPVQELLDAVARLPENQLRKEFERILADQDALKPKKTTFELAMEKLKLDALNLPMKFEFEIPQVIGSELWLALDRASKLALGKHVKASQAAYGITFLRKSASHHAIYSRSE